VAVQLGTFVKTVYEEEEKKVKNGSTQFLIMYTPIHISNVQDQLKQEDSNVHRIFQSLTLPNFDCQNRQDTCW
jgi:hypothetical protein